MSSKYKPTEYLGVYQRPDGYFTYHIEENYYSNELFLTAKEACDALHQYFWPSH